MRVWAGDRKMWLLSREQMSLLLWLFNLGHVSAGARVPLTCAVFALHWSCWLISRVGVLKALGPTHTFSNPMVLS